MALTPGEQALVARGNLVTSSFIPAESRARINAAIQAQQSSAPIQVSTPVQTQAPAPTGGMLSTPSQSRTPVASVPPIPTLDSTTLFSTTDPTSLIQQIYTDELGRALGSKEGDTGALDYWTSRLQSGATPEQIRAEIEGSPEGRAFDVSSTYTGLLGRAADPEGQQYWTQQLETGALTPKQMRTSFLQSEEFLGDVAPQFTKTSEEAALGALDTGSIADLGTFFYNERKAGRKIPVEVVEGLGYARSDDRQTAFEFAKGGQAYSEGLEALDQAIAAGDVDRANELKTALADEQGFFDYYEKNIATEIGQEAVNLRNETAVGDVFGVGDPGKYVTTWLDRVGDSISDVAQNPYVQAVVTLVSPDAGALINAWGTLDSGNDLSPAQLAAVAAAAAGYSGLEGGKLKDLLPPELDEFANTIEKYFEGNFEKGRAALSRLFPNQTTEQLAKLEDYFRTVVGNENIQDFENYISGLGGDLTDLFSGQFGSLQDQLNALEAALTAERQPSFVAQRGYQPGLPVDTQFDIDNGSLVLEILNQPSTRTA